MKKLITKITPPNFISILAIYLGLLSVLVISCNDKPPTPDPLPKSEYLSTCTLNGELWTGYISSYNSQYNDSQCSINIQNYITKGGQELYWDVIGIQNINKQIGKQTINNMFTARPLWKIYGGYHWPDDDGDAGCDSYEVLESDSVNNWIEITEQENEFEIIRGKYSMTLIRFETCATSPLPDTVRIRDGVFEVKIK